MIVLNRILNKDKTAPILNNAPTCAMELVAPIIDKIQTVILVEKILYTSTGKMRLTICKIFFLIWIFSFWIEETNLLDIFLSLKFAIIRGIPVAIIAIGVKGIKKTEGIVNNNLPMFAIIRFFCKGFIS